MLRFFAGILLVQSATAALILIAGGEAHDWGSWLPFGVAIGVIGLVAAFWFSSLAANIRRDEVARLREVFAREREDLRVKAERAKTQLVRKTHKDLASETRRAEARANRKVALSVAAASGVGLLMMMTSLMSLGLTLFAGAGGALGGYLVGRKGLMGMPGRDGGTEEKLLATRRRWLRLGSSQVAKK